MRCRDLFATSREAVRAPCETRNQASRASEAENVGSTASGASVVQVKVTAEAARRFLVARHFLAPARSLVGGLDGVLEVFRRFGSIQFDPIAVAGRNHDLVFHARVAG